MKFTVFFVYSWIIKQCFNTSDYIVQNDSKTGDYMNWKGYGRELKAGTRDGQVVNTRMGLQVL
jgi:hypothetical protein